MQRLADTIGIIHEGRLLVHSPVDTLLDKTKRIRAVLEDGHAPNGEVSDLGLEEIFKDYVRGGRAGA